MIDRLTPEDRLMLSASATWPQDIVAVAVLDGSGLLEADGRLRTSAVLDWLRSRLDRVPRFRQVIRVPRRGLGGPYWLDAPGFDITDHVRVRDLPAGSGESALLEATEELRAAPLDPSRPLWQMCFLTGLEAGRVVWVVKTHHAMADGLAAMASIRALLDTDAAFGQLEPSGWSAMPPPADRQLFLDNVARRGRTVASAVSSLVHPVATARRIRGAWPAIRELVAEAPVPATSLGRLIGTSRALAVLRTPAALVRRIGRAHGASVNDVLLAALAGGLRALLVSRAEPVDGLGVRVYVPVTLRRRLGGEQHGNRIAQMVVPLPLGIVDPSERLRRIAAETAVRKARSRSSLGTIFRGRMVRGLLLRAVIRQRIHVTTASLPGPRRPMFLGGARVLEVFPVLPLIGNVALGVGAISYAGGFQIGIAADRDAYPDLAVLVAGMQAELDALASPSAPTRPSRGGRSAKRLKERKPQRQPVAVR